MILKVIKITFINFLILIVLTIFIVSFSYILKILLGGPALYGQPRFKIKNSDIIKYKSDYYKVSQVKNDFYKFYQTEYFKNYSGKFIKVFCGKEENGFLDLIYKTDKFGFRENEDELYNKVDYILLGDSFVFSICINKPYDLSSQIKKKTNKTILNLGVWGSQPYSQLAYFSNITKNTNMKNLIWFFYEGNDYEEPLVEKINTYNQILSMNEQELFKFITTRTVSSHTENLDYNNKNFDNYMIKNKNIDKKYLEITKIKFLENIIGLSSMVKLFKKYNNLLSYRDYEEIVRSMNLILNEKKVEKKYIYYIPSYLRLSYTSNYLNNYNNQIQQLNFLKNQVQKIAEENNFHFIDGTIKFNEEHFIDKIFFYGLPTHFNEKGYEILAEDLYEKIIK